MKLKPILILLTLLASISILPTAVLAQAKQPTSGGAASKPNILVIWGDDIGWYNPSIYHKDSSGGQH